MGSEAPEPLRGRVVMLVNNGVKGDSRVQKSAASAAAAGWDVVLLGASPDGRRHQWSHEGAEVRLLPKPSPLSVRAHDVRTPVLRRPLAYRDSRKAAQRAQWVKAYRADLRVRRASLAVARRRDGPSAALRLRAAGLAVPRATSRLLRKWVALRTHQLASAQRHRGSLNTAADRMAVTFWKTVLRGRAWRRLVPHLLDFDLAFSREIAGLEPDLIHAHDYHMLGVAARAVVRARAEGRRVKLVWDAHEYVPGLNAPNPRWLAGVSGYERAHAAQADAVVTVSPPLAELLRGSYRLPELPTVTLNAPVSAPPAEAYAGPGDGAGPGDDGGSGDD
ncbi:glycosyltransferase family 4 protein, partial [Streptomyces boncukensis]